MPRLSRLVGTKGHAGQAPLRGPFFRGAQVSGIIALRQLESLVQLLELRKPRKPRLSVPVSGLLRRATAEQR